MDSEDVRLVRVVPDPECVWCGEPVSQLGTRTPRRFCKRSHRQRALEARKLGLPMKRDRPPKDPKTKQAALTRAEADRQAALFVAELVERTSVDVPPPAPVIPAPARSEAAQEAVTVPAPAKAPRRRSAITASAMPLPPAEAADPDVSANPWLAAVERTVRVRQQPGLFEVDPDDE